jgi:hypothetical protein
MYGLLAYIQTKYQPYINLKQYHYDDLIGVTFPKNPSVCSWIVKESFYVW